MTRSKTFAALVITGVSLQAFVGCSQVLGIEEATLDPTASGGAAGTTQTSSGGGVTTMHVLPTTDLGECPAADPATDQCLACVEQHAQGVLPACLNDPNCRTGLEAYRGCLANSDCNEPAGSPCVEQLHNASAALGAALVQDCKTPCMGKALVSMCEIYCSCMASNCPGDTAACLANCPSEATFGALGPWLTFCRWEHCEFARVSGDALHCAHARGEGACAGAPPPSEATCQAGRKHSGFICARDSDCCGECHDNLCQ